MATVVNNPQPSMTDRSYIERTTDGDTAGWAIAIILLLVVVALGLFFWVRANNAAAPASTVPSTINVSVPAPASNPGATTPGADTGAGAGASGGTSGSGTVAP